MIVQWLLWILFWDFTNQDFFSGKNLDDWGFCPLECVLHMFTMEIGWFTTHKCGTLATEKSGCVIKLECLKTTDPKWVCLSYSKGASHIRMGFVIKTTLCRGQPDKWDSPYNPRKCSRKSPCWCTAGSCFWGKPGDILQLPGHQTKGALRCGSKVGIGKSL